MSDKKHIIIFSHGFGVKKDSRGMFTEIAARLTNVESIMFDYNEIDDANNRIIVQDFKEQSRRLSNTIKETKNNNPEAIIDIIGHSQGCVIVAMARPIGVRKVLFIAPPNDLDTSRTVDYFKSRSGTEINLKGISRLARQDGSITIVPPEYWAVKDEIQGRLLELYKELSKVTDLSIINAKQDVILGKVDFSDLAVIKFIIWDGDHNFKDEDTRRGLLENLEKLIK